MNKILRQKISNKRIGLAQTFRKDASQKVADAIINSPTYKNSKYIAFYIAIRGEIDPAPIIKHAWQKNKICYLPILQDEHLIFGKYCAGDTLINNQYGIPEPSDNLELIDPKNLDMAIVPLVAFDKNRNRLGTGKGYYDRTFAFKKQLPSGKPNLIGIAYSFQQVAELFPQPWDVPLDFVVTEQNNKDLAI